MTLEEYLAGLTEEGRAAIENLRRLVRGAVPEAAEGISYGMPAFKYRGRNLVYFGAWKSHCAVYGLNLAGHADELAGYDTATGTLRLPLGRALPEDLLASMIRERADEIEAGRR